MTISLIAAVSTNNAIGRNNSLPWHLPDDLKFFKKMTLGKPVLMGRRTFDALGKPLPGRLNVVLSRSNNLELPAGVMHFHTLEEALGYTEHYGANHNLDECFIIGGGEIFELSMKVADRMYITKVETNITDADAFFPEIDHTHWVLKWDEHHDSDAGHSFAFSFQKYERTEL